MKVALIHDYLFAYGGAERVLEALHEIWPDAPVFTAFVDWDWVGKNRKEWLNWKIIPSWFQRFPFHQQLCSALRFLAPWIWESFDLSGFDLVVSSSAWFISKGLITYPKTAHVCYCHTPPRYLYGYPESIRKNWLARVYATLVNPFMRRYDFLTSQRVDYFICNSKEVQRRIKKFYRREAKVIYPPILARSRWQVAGGKRKTTSHKPPATGYYLMVNRLVWPKRVDLAIRTCKKLKLNLKIVGEGKAEKELKKLAEGSPFIEFLGYVSDERLSQLYSNCKAVLYLGEEEDFGITPVEAMAYGKPVIALRSGGIPESVIEGKTGIFIDKPSVEELIKVLKKFNDSNYQTISPEQCIRQARKFNKERFKREIKKFVEGKFALNAKQRSCRFYSSSEER